jgi:hypothetical protein
VGIYLQVLESSPRLGRLSRLIPCWQTRKPGKAGSKCPTAAMMSKLAVHVSSFDDLLLAVLS